MSFEIQHFLMKTDEVLNMFAIGEDGVGAAATSIQRLRRRINHGQTEQVSPQHSFDACDVIYQHAAEGTCTKDASEDHALLSPSLKL